MLKRLWHNNYPEWAPREIDVARLLTLPEMMDDACRRYADLPALACFGEVLFYGEVDELADRFARFLQHELGMKAGDRLAIMLPNVFQFPIAFLAAQRLGVICVPTNPLYTPREMRHQFSDSGSEVLLISDLFLDKLQQILPETPIRHVIATGVADCCALWRRTAIHGIMRLKRMIPSANVQRVGFREALAIGATRPGLNRPTVKPDDTAVLQYTGGTTGVSKGAMLTHRNIAANVEQILAYAGPMIRPGEETALTALPLYHIFSLTVNFLAFFSKGSRLVLLPKPMPIKNVVKTFQRYPITLMTGVNTLFNALCNHDGFMGAPPRGLRLVIAGGMPLSLQVWKKWAAATGNEIIEGFGMTECSPVTHCNPCSDKNRPGTIGLPLPSTLARVVDPNGVDVPEGESGELLIQGPQVMKGYWRNGVVDTDTFVDGWLRTGDMARVDTDGFFRICERKKDMILISGFNVFPREVEEVLTSHPKVLEAAVIGLPDTRSGEAVKAYVVRRDQSLTVEELRDFCHKELSGYKRPRFFEFRESLPKSPVGKILKRELRDEELKKN